MSAPEPDYRCPACNTDSAMILGPTQAVCTNETGCDVLTFDPSLPDGGLGDANVFDLGGLYIPQGGKKE